MPTVNLGNLEIPAGVNLPTLKQALGYSDTIDDPENPGSTIPNPVTLKEHFMDNHVLPSLRRRYRNQLDANRSAADKAESDLITRS